MKVNKGNPEIDALNEEDLARYFEEHQDDETIWEPEAVHTSKRPVSTVLSLRIAPEELEELHSAAIRQHRTVSDIVRTGALKEARDGAESKALREARAKARDLAETLERL